MRKTQIQSPSRVDLVRGVCHDTVELRKVPGSVQKGHTEGSTLEHVVSRRIRCGLYAVGSVYFGASWPRKPYFIATREVCARERI